MAKASDELNSVVVVKRERTRGEPLGLLRVLRGAQHERVAHSRRSGAQHQAQQQSQRERYGARAELLSCRCSAGCSSCRFHCCAHARGVQACQRESERHSSCPGPL